MVTATDIQVFTDWSLIMTFVYADTTHTCLSPCPLFLCVYSSKRSCGQAAQTQGSCVSGTSITDTHPRESPCHAVQESPVWFKSRTRWPFLVFLVTQSCTWKHKVINDFFHILSNFLDALSSSQIWVGCHGRSGVGGQCEGQVLVLDPESHAVTKELQGHLDSIQTLCTAEDRYVLSGSARRDGKIAIWTVEWWRKVKWSIFLSNDFCNAMLGDWE